MMQTINLSEQLLAAMPIQAVCRITTDSFTLVRISFMIAADPSNIEPGHTSVLDSFAMKYTLSAIPSSYRLSFDWR